MINGIDLSSVQTILSPSAWLALAKRGTRFAVAKCGNGNDSPDPAFARHIAGARSVGLHVGAYHFVYPLPDAPGHAGRDPIAQAQAHWAASDGLGADKLQLPPCVDVEWPAPTDWQKWGVSAAFVVAWVAAYMGKLESLAGVTPILYTYPDFAKCVGFHTTFARYPLWAAEYDVLQPIAPWAGWTILQTAGGKPSALSRRFMQDTMLPNGVPVDTDCIADEATLQGLLMRG